MESEPSVKVDVVILGGGIAGLWLLARLRGAGYSALLLETGRLGGGQTMAAQGIIHGGVKYTLNLRLGTSARAVADMPARWRACLAGAGDVDLRSARLLASHHAFWLPHGLAPAVTAFFASHALQSRTERLAPTAWPAPLRQASVATVFRLDEPVVEVQSVVAALAAPHGDCIRAVDGAGAVDLSAGPEGRLTIRGAGGTVTVAAGCIVATAGAGNEMLLDTFPAKARRTQRRPLGMVMLKGMPAHLHAHCFAGSDKPRLTVTSHTARDGKIVWYIGGELAEAGSRLAPAALLDRARAELAALLPDLDLAAVRGATLAIDRAEPATAGRRRPETPVARRHGRLMVAWPSKLALAPRLADLLLGDIQDLELRPSAGRLGPLADWPQPAVAPPPWEEATWS